jgi:predicted metal-dependent phosphoesterase TrpH
MKCDLHVHTIHSGMCTVPVARRFCRESYNSPEAVYEKLKRVGMDVVTITDHDSIDAAECLRKYPDFFLSEEVTCTLPSGTEAHVAVYDICERQHIQLQRKRNDFPALLAFLREQNLFFGVNHVFSGLTGRRDGSDFDLFESAFPGWEVRNGAMIGRSNQCAAELAFLLGKAPTAGSDAHTMRGVGSVYTSVASARTRQEFLDGLRNGHGIAHGDSGAWWKLTADVLSISAGLVAERPWTLALAPLLAALPAVTAANYVLETVFAERWFSRVLDRQQAPRTRIMEGVSA